MPFISHMKFIFICLAKLWCSRVTQIGNQFNIGHFNFNHYQVTEWNNRNESNKLAY